jgi:hypothetical protein
MPAVAITDQCNLFALVRFYKAAVAAGLKPIAGADLWCATRRTPTSRTVWCCWSRTDRLPQSHPADLAGLCRGPASRGAPGGARLDRVRRRGSDRALGRAAGRCRPTAPERAPRGRRAPGSRSGSRSSATAITWSWSAPGASRRPSWSRRAWIWPSAGRAGGGDQRRALSPSRGLRGPRGAGLYPRGAHPGRPAPPAPLQRRAVAAQPRGDGRALRRSARGAGELGRDRQALQPGADPRQELPAGFPGAGRDDHGQLFRRGLARGLEGASQRILDPEAPDLAEQRRLYDERLDLELGSSPRWASPATS